MSPLFPSQIAGAHTSASASLLRLLVGDKDLMVLLRSIKHYFLLDQVCRGGLWRRGVEEGYGPGSWGRGSRRTKAVVHWDRKGVEEGYGPGPWERGSRRTEAVVHWHRKACTPRGPNRHLIHTLHFPHLPHPG